MHIGLAEATHADWPAILMIEKSLPPDERIDREWLRRTCLAKATADTLAWVGGVPVGYTVVAPRTLTVTVLRVVVAAGWRRHGVGHALFDRLKAKLKMRRAVVTASDANLPLHLFLRAEGFLASPRVERGVHPGGGDAYVFDFGGPAHFLGVAFSGQSSRDC